MFVLTEDDDEDDDEEEAAEGKPAGEAASAVESTLEGAKVLIDKTWLLHLPLSQESANCLPEGNTDTVTRQATCNFQLHQGCMLPAVIEDTLLCERTE